MSIARLIFSWCLASSALGSTWAAIGLAATRRANRLRSELHAGRSSVIGVPATTDAEHGSRTDRVEEIEAIRRRARFRVLPGGGEAVPA